MGNSRPNAVSLIFPQGLLVTYLISAKPLWHQQHVSERLNFLLNLIVQLVSAKEHTSVDASTYFRPSSGLCAPSG